MYLVLKPGTVDNARRCGFVLEWCWWLKSIVGVVGSDVKKDAELRVGSDWMWVDWLVESVRDDFSCILT